MKLLIFFHFYYFYFYYFLLFINHLGPLAFLLLRLHQIGLHCLYVPTLFLSSLRQKYQEEEKKLSYNLLLILRWPLFVCVVCLFVLCVFFCGVYVFVFGRIKEEKRVKK